jgi:hypothetical protein
MSRTNKGKRHTGYEYWSKRPISNKSGAVPGKETKRRTHRAERRQAKKQVKKLEE